MIFFKRIYAWLIRKFTKEKRYGMEKTAELPDHIDANSVYLLGEGSYLWSAVMKCPCGCQETLHMNLLADVKPKWAAKEHFDGTVTLHPSVHRKVGCKSHFFIRKGKVFWC